jgi:hypothetical protein
MNLGIGIYFKVCHYYMQSLSLPYIIFNFINFKLNFEF